jgi:peptidoglycan/LPS O-acetylase OafA/YrhL
LAAATLVDRLRPNDGRAPASRQPGLDLLRVLACALVVAFHFEGVVHVDFGPLNAVVRGGDTGVFVFFALSGYLLYRPFLRGSVDLGAYSIKRAARILPGYFVALACLAFLTGNPLPGEHPLAYLSTMAPYSAELRGFLGNAWTLSAELIFYVALPFLARFLDSAPIPRLSIIALASVVASVLLGAVDKSGIEWAVGAFPFVFYAFVPGMLLAVVEVRDPKTFAKLSEPWVAVVGGGMVIVQTLLHGFPVALAAGIGTPLLIGWLATVRVPFPRALAFAGGASYAMYLWHKDLSISFGAAGLLIALAGSVFSWWLVERPLLAVAHFIAARRKGDELAVAVTPAVP